MWLERLYRPLDLKNDVIHKPAEIRFSYRCSTYLKFKPWFIFRGKKFALGYFWSKETPQVWVVSQVCFGSEKKNGRQLHLACPPPPPKWWAFWWWQTVGKLPQPPLSNTHTHTRARARSIGSFDHDQNTDLPSPHLKKRLAIYTRPLQK